MVGSLIWPGVVNMCILNNPKNDLTLTASQKKGKGLVIDDMIARIITYSYYLCWLWVLLVEIGLKTFSLADLAYKMYEVVYNWVQSC